MLKKGNFILKKPNKTGIKEKDDKQKNNGFY